MVRRRSRTASEFSSVGRLVAALTAACVLLGGASTALARTWTVMKDGSGDFIVIQDAIDAAASGDVIQLGPGRFEEWHTFAFPAGTADAYMLTRHALLTIVGSGPEVTIIGPPMGPGTEQDPIGIMTDVGTRLYVRDLSVENTDDGVQANGPYVSLQNCSFRGCQQGLDTVAWEGTLVQNCNVADTEIGVVVFQGLGATNVLIENCQFQNGLAGIDLQSQSSTVRNCQFTGQVLGVQLSFGAQATIEGCTFEEMLSYGVVTTGGARGILNNCFLGITQVNLAVFNESQLSGSGNVFAGGTFRTITMSGAPTQLELHDCHILNGGGWTFYIGGTSSPQVIDLRNNWWGTTDAAQIDAWTRDFKDGAANTTVLFEPFHGMPISAESTSFGKLKARFDQRAP